MNLSIRQPGSFRTARPASNGRTHVASTFLVARKWANWRRTLGQDLKRLPLVELAFPGQIRMFFATYGLQFQFRAPSQVWTLNCKNYKSTYQDPIWEN